MPTETDPATRGRKPKRSPPLRQAPNAIALLRAAHTELQQMFTAFENTRSVNNKRFLVQRICTTVALHSQMKEEVFYPAIEAVLRRSRPEHGSMKALVTHIRSLEPVAEQVDGPIKMLAEHVNQHVSDLHDDMFPQVDASDIDLVELGDRMARRKAELIAQEA